MNKIFLLIGGNLGDRNAVIVAARNLIEKEIGPIINLSAVYETASWGINDQPDFLNQVLEVNSGFSASEVLKRILSIENRMGRIRTRKNASRIIDIDILFYNEDIIHIPGLTIPHPEIQNRKFALVPMADIAPGLMHPVLKRTVAELLSTSGDTLEVKPVGPE